ncbi:MAG: hypothetical protein AB7O97_03330 [Planctomycetota bacterium]
MPRALALAVLTVVAAVPLAAQGPAVDEPLQPSAMFTERAQRRAAFKDRKVQQAIQQGLVWLCAHQDEDGRWDADQFFKHDGSEPSDGPGNGVHDLGVTALALLALLAEADPSRTEAATRAADWIAAQRGEVGKEAEPGFLGAGIHDAIYHHALATLALVEAGAVLDSARWRDTAAAAVQCLLRRRNPEGAWRYNPRDGESDTSVTAWCTAALVAARHAGTEVPAADLGKALAWIDAVTDGMGRTGYSAPGEPSARRSGEHMVRFPVEFGEAMTAAALHTRLLLGQDPALAAPERAGELLLAKPPTTKQAAVDHYYWLHGSQAMAHMPKAATAAWFKALDATLLEQQRRDGTAAGSWDPSGAWGEDGGRVYATAAAVLSLQARYRLGELGMLAGMPRSGALAKVRAFLLKGDLAAALPWLDRLRDDAALGAGERRVLADLDWLLDVDRQSIRTRIALLRAAQSPDWYALSCVLDRARTDYRGTALGDDADAQWQTLQDDARAAAHLEAGRRLDALRKKYGERTPRDPTALREQLKWILEHHGDTPAGQLARWWLQRL